MSEKKDKHNEVKDGANKNSSNAGKISKIEDIKITPNDVVARMVNYQDGSMGIQTFFRPTKKWFDGGLDFGSYMWAPSATASYLRSVDFTDEEIEKIFDGFTGIPID
jgi:hypothetical protein